MCLRLVLEYYCLYTDNTLTISVFNALSIGSGLVAAVLHTGRYYLSYDIIFDV